MRTPKQILTYFVRVVGSHRDVNFPRESEADLAALCWLSCWAKQVTRWLRWTCEDTQTNPYLLCSSGSVDTGT